MRAKTILTVLFLISLAVAVIVILRAMPTQGDANANTPKEEILVATVQLAAGTLLRAQDVTGQSVTRPVEPAEIVRPSAVARQVRPEVDEETRAGGYGAAGRPARGTAGGGEVVGRGGPPGALRGGGGADPAQQHRQAGRPRFSTGRADPWSASDRHP